MMKDIQKQLEAYAGALCLEEKSLATIERYTRVIREFLQFIDGGEITKELVIEYKRYLSRKHKAAGVNVKLAAVNSFLKYLGKEECFVRYLRVQRQMFVDEEKELTKYEYQWLLKVAKGKQIYYIMKAICSTGIRVSELIHITVEALCKGQAVVYCKNKVRKILIPQEICQELLIYAKDNGIQSGVIFLNRKKKPVDRTKVWKEMKKLCAQAGVDPKKVFPHNLRHLFARTFYASEKDIVKLADLLGHSSLQTTRIYTIESGAEHKKGLERVQKMLNCV